MCPFSKIEKSGKSLHPSLLQNGSSQPSALDNITFCLFLFRCEAGTETTV